MNGIGSVDSIWRYPAKSMLGEQLTEVECKKLRLLVGRRWKAIA